MATFTVLGFFLIPVCIHPVYILMDTGYSVLHLWGVKLGLCAREAGCLSGGNLNFKNCQKRKQNPNAVFFFP